MDAIFIKILNMSIAAGWLVLAVVAARLAFRKLPRALFCVLWALVGLRLVVPSLPASNFSLIPSAETVPHGIGATGEPMISSGVSFLNQAINPVISEPAPMGGENLIQKLLNVLPWIWLAGLGGMVVYMVISYLRLALQVREATPGERGVWLCDSVSSPFILGFFRPRIYLPSAMEAADIPFVVAHERAHLRRRDHLWKPLGFLLLSVYWFHPLMWVAYLLLCRDIEVACDEKVIAELGEEGRKDYSRALINQSAPRRLISACPLAFGEVGLRGRVRSVLNYKKPAFWILLFCVILCIVASVCFLTDPKDTALTELTGENQLLVVPKEATTVQISFFDNLQIMLCDKDIARGLSEIRVSKKPISTS